MTFFKRAPSFRCANESVPRRGWWKNTAGRWHRWRGWSRCGRSGSNVLDFEFRLDCLLYTYAVDIMRSDLRIIQHASNLPERNWVIRGLFVVPTSRLILERPIWKGFWRKHFWRSGRTVPKFSSRKWENTRKFPVRLAGEAVQNLTRHLPSTSRERYRYPNLLCFTVTQSRTTWLLHCSIRSFKQSVTVS